MITIFSVIFYCFFVCCSLFMTGNWNHVRVQLTGSWNHKRVYLQRALAIGTLLSIDLNLPPPQMVLVQ